MVGILGRVISPSQGLYLHRTTQHRKTRTNIHTLSGIRTHNPSNQPAKAHASDRKATVTGTGELQYDKSNLKKIRTEFNNKWSPAILLKVDEVLNVLMNEWIYLFIYGLFNDAVNISDLRASNDRMISE
jgi:hypothetical protein